MKTFILFLAIASTLHFISQKFSAATKAIAFQEEETIKEALIALVTMFIISLTWALYFTCFNYH